MAETKSIVETLLTRNLFEVFGEHDAVRRRAAIKELFTEDCTVSDPHGRQTGHEALDAAVVALHKMQPGFVFKQIGAPQALQDSGRLAWAFGPHEQPEKITGLDVIVVRGDRIAALYTFLDQPPA